jgi:hypothetical protein
VVAAVCGSGARSRRDVPAVGVVWVNGERPAVRQVSAVVECGPGAAAVVAPRGTVAGRLVRAGLRVWVPDDGVRVAFGARPVVGEACTRVVCEHEAAELDADEKPFGVLWCGGDPAYAVRPWAGREAPRVT